MNPYKIRNFTIKLKLNRNGMHDLPKFLHYKSEKYTKYQGHEIYTIIRLISLNFILKLEKRIDILM